MNWMRRARRARRAVKARARARVRRRRMRRMRRWRRVGRIRMVRRRSMSMEIQSMRGLLMLLTQPGCLPPPLQTNCLFRHVHRVLTSLFCPGYVLYYNFFTNII